MPSYITPPGSAGNPNPNDELPGYTSETTLAVEIASTVAGTVYYKAFYRAAGTGVEEDYKIVKHIPDNSGREGRFAASFCSSGDLAAGTTHTDDAAVESDERIYFDDSAADIQMWRVPVSPNQADASSLGTSTTAVQAANTQGDSGERSFSIQIGGVETAKTLVYSDLPSGRPRNPGEIAIDPETGIVRFFRFSEWDGSGAESTCWDDDDAYWDDGNEGRGYSGNAVNELYDVLVTDGDAVDLYCHIEDDSVPTTVDINTQTGSVASPGGSFSISSLVGFHKISFFQPTASESTPGKDQYYEIGTAFRIDLNNELTLISIPRVLSGDDALWENIISGQDVDFVMTAEDGQWKFYMPSADSSLNTLTTAEPGKAYLIATNSLAQISVVGDLPTTTSITIKSQEDILVNNGINMVGVPIFEDSRDLETYFTDINGDLVDFLLIITISDDLFWRTYIPGRADDLNFEGSSVVQRQKGYVVFSNQTQTIDVDYTE